MQAAGSNTHVLARCLCRRKTAMAPNSPDRYGILGFNVPLDTVQVISETGGPEQ